jgi:predicted O-methyltransferase YrrM
VCPTPPKALEAIAQKTREIGFDMAGDALVGALLQSLAASKRGGRLLELGTGTGLSTAWIAQGMDPASRLISVDNDPQLLHIARSHITDPRIEFVCSDAAKYLKSLAGERFDLIFADTWAGKYEMLDETLELLAPGGLYVIDDMLPQPNWPAGHDHKARALREQLFSRRDLAVCELAWASGVMICAKR